MAVGLRVSHLSKNFLGQMNSYTKRQFSNTNHKNVDGNVIIGTELSFEVYSNYMYK
jgi:hypothetical protein